MEKIKIGLVGCSQLSFPGDKLSAFEANSLKMGALSRELNFDLYVYPNQVIVAEDGYIARKVLEEEKVDLIMLQTTSFSAGCLAPIFARTKNAKLGLWAIPEGCDSGVVPFNSFCGIGMYSSIIGHYLKDYKIPLKWFFGNADDEMFCKRLALTVRALTAIKSMKSSKVALVGGIAPGFDDLYDDERNLIKLFDGMQINRLHEYDELKKRAESMSEQKVADKLNAQIAMGNGFTHETARKMMEVNARYALAYEDFIKEYQYAAVAISCWPKFQEDYLYSVCAVVGEINDNGIVAACEGDLTSAISMLLLKYLADDIPTLMDLSAMDSEDESVLMWHCGPTSKRFCEKNGFKYGLNYSGWSHEDDGDEVSGTGTVRDMVFDPDKVTFARLTGESDTMFLAGGEILEGNKPSFNGSRGWVGNLTINKQKVNALDFFNTLFTERFQHHFPMIRGDWNDEVLETMAWLGLTPMNIVPYTDAMQNPTWWN